MAVATCIFTQSAYPNGQDKTLRRLIIHGTVAIQASSATYVAGGLPITLKLGAGGIDLPGLSNPRAVRGTFDSRSGSGYVYFWTTVDLWTANYKNTTPALGQSLVDTNGNIQTITTSGAAGTGTEPIWNKTKGGTTTDASAVWTNKGPSQGILQVFQQSAATSALTEIPAGSVPAGVSGDTISGEFQFIQG